MRTTLTVLASEALEHKTWWNPYLKGALIAILAVGLFVGSAYLLLYTNVGTRLGFLLTAAAFTGFMTVLTIFWITAQLPQGPKGKLPGWPVNEIVPELSESRFGAVRDITQTGAKAGSGDAGQIRTELEKQLTEEGSAFKRFKEAKDFVSVRTFTKGGGRKWPLWFTEKTTYGAVEICPAAAQSVLPLEAPPTPKCDPDKPTEWAIVRKDLGAIRLPGFFFFGGSSLLFALSLVALRRYERDLEQPTTGGGGDADDGAGPSGNGGEPEGTEAELEPATT